MAYLKKGENNTMYLEKISKLWNENCKLRREIHDLEMKNFKNTCKISALERKVNEDPLAKKALTEHDKIWKAILAESSRALARDKEFFSQTCICMKWFDSNTL